MEIHTRPKLCHFGRKNRDLCNRVIPASHMNTSIFFTKKRVARRDLGNRASPVDRAPYEEALSQRDWKLKVFKLKSARLLCL